MSMQNVRQLTNKLVELVYPAKCIGCGNTGSYICEGCYIKLNNITIPPFNLNKTTDSCIYVNPESLPSNSAIDGIYYPFRFEGLIRECVHKFKYQNYKALAIPLSQLLNKYLHFVHFTVDILIPVPLHLKRLRQRGYNQSHLLATELGKYLRIPVNSSTLVRIVDTIPQTDTTTSAERKNNVRHAFKCVNNTLAAKKVMLIDDVCTTAATLNACAVAIKKVGATHVWGLTVAREI